MREMEGIISTLEIDDRTEIHNQIRHLQSEADKYKSLSMNVMTEMARMKEEWEERLSAQQRQFEQQLKEQKEALVGRTTDCGRLDETTDSSESSVSLADGQTEKCPKIADRAQGMDQNKGAVADSSKETNNLCEICFIGKANIEHRMPHISPDVHLELVLFEHGQAQLPCL
ncbi:hypothetical protein PMAYCL1PPCAC_14520 [Pristionchus mayeri]|uniref:Uncharacterized protein n=1 Tax=Pristionchus mayeri TaxID=1317129 RepID=A0AAN4ZVG2_9BILA|nr:hypothetical protein PMAYCL1PPCAC_14520 [Pristionchus mayeri]